MIKTEMLKAQKVPEADYPREVWFAALNAYQEIGQRSSGTTSERVNAIADAIMAERKRCADQVCFPADWLYRKDQSVAAILEDIIARIQSGEA